MKTYLVKYNNDNEVKVVAIDKDHARSKIKEAVKAVKVINSVIEIK